MQKANKVFLVWKSHRLPLKKTAEAVQCFLALPWFSALAHRLHASHGSGAIPANSLLSTRLCWQRLALVNGALGWWCPRVRRIQALGGWLFCLLTLRHTFTIEFEARGAGWCATCSNLLGPSTPLGMEHRHSLRGLPLFNFGACQAPLDPDH